MANAFKIGLILVTGVLFASCHRTRPKPVSKDYTKISVTDSEHRDSIIDNKPRLYNASIPETCIKCVVAEIRKVKKLKPYLSAADSAKIVYEVDWFSGPKSNDSIKNAGSGLLITVFKNTVEARVTLAVFTFDNVDGQLSYIDSHNGNQGETIRIDSAVRLKIRRACFWGVASEK